MKTLFGCALLVLLLAAWIGPAAAFDVTRQPVTAPAELPGLYTLVLIGEAGSGSDAERLALFDPEGDGYTFRPVTPDYRVKRLAGLTAPAALAEAERFFAGHCAYNGYRVKSLALSNGVPVGYELLPDYPLALCENGNVVAASYIVGANGEIKVYTNLVLPVGDGPPFDKATLGKER